MAPAAPNYDALAIAVSQQNNLIGCIALLIGVVGLAAAAGWGFLVKIWAEREARDTAREWMDRHAPDIMAKLAAPLQSSPTAPSEAEPLSPSEQAEELETEGD